MTKIDFRFSVSAANAVAFFFVCFALTCAAALCVSTRSAVAAPQCPEGVEATIPNQGGPSTCTPATKLPATKRFLEFPPVTIARGEREGSIDLFEIKPSIKAGETLEVEVLTPEGKEYVGELADFYRLADTFCFMATLSSDLAIAQRCPRANATQAVGRWTTAVNHLGEIARGVTLDKKAAASYAAFVRANPGTVYLIVNGRGVVPAMVKDLQGFLTGTTPIAKPLAIEFEGCSVPKIALGQKLSEVCHSSLPLPPLAATLSDNLDRIVLRRQTEEKASVVVRVSSRTKALRGIRPKQTLQAFIPVELEKASKETTALTGTTTVRQSTTTTATTPGSESSFKAQCGGSNSIEVNYDGPEISRVYVGTYCKPNNVHPRGGCFINGDGVCGGNGKDCKAFCNRFEERFSEYLTKRAAADQACYDLQAANNRNHPTEAGQCPGMCEVKGTKGCINEAGPGKFVAGKLLRKGFVADRAGIERGEQSSDDWNTCWNAYCEIGSGYPLRLSWRCSNCVMDPSWTPEVPATPTPVVVATSTPVATATPGGTRTRVATPTPVVVATSTPVATATPGGTRTRVATPTPVVVATSTPESSDSSAESDSSQSSSEVARPTPKATPNVVVVSPGGDPRFTGCTASKGTKYCGCVVGFQDGLMPRFELYKSIPEENCVLGRIAVRKPGITYEVFRVQRNYYNP